MRGDGGGRPCREGQMDIAFLVLLGGAGLILAVRTAVGQEGSCLRRSTGFWALRPCWLLIFLPRSRGSIWGLMCSMG